jgi:DNA helicase-4
VLHALIKFIKDLTGKTSKAFRERAKEFYRIWHFFLEEDIYLTYVRKKQILRKLDEHRHEFYAIKIPFYMWIFPSVWRDKRLYDSIFDHLKDKINDYNDEYVKRKLAEYADFFDGKEGGFKFPLDADQRKCIVRDDIHSLVIASAGSGKTEVIAGKIAYLVKKRGVKPYRILALAYARKAAAELKDRLQVKHGINANVSTFHKFGKSIITETKKEPLNVLDETNGEPREDVIRRLYDECSKDAEFQKLVVEHLTNGLDEDIEDVDFKTKQEYYEYLNSKKYTTLENKKVKSIAEKEIANFLFTNNIKFRYEDTASWADRTSNRPPYKPDFYLPDYDVYIEHWGLDKQNHVPDWFSVSSEAYLGQKRWKLQQFKKHQKRLIQTWSFERNEGTLLNNLERRLQEELPDIQFANLSLEGIIKQTYKASTLKNDLLKQIDNFIKTAKSNGFSVADIGERCKDSRFKRSQKVMAKLALHVYTKYEAELKETGRIDYEDMINRAISAVEAEKERFADRYDYILVDEFQDISFQRYLLLKQFVNSKTQTKLLCVGDDWQSIYGFTGADMSIILNFQKSFEEPDTSFLQTNYRSTKAIVDVSNKVISKNTQKIEKDVKSANGAGKRPEVIVCPDETTQNEDVANRIEELLDKKEYPRDIMVLMRFNKNATSFKQVCKERRIPVEDEHERTKGILVLTAHSSKGKEAKHVFVLNVTAGRYGFPCEIEEPTYLEVARRNSVERSLEKERRLFYVAITRSRENLAVYTLNGQSSVFIQEINN